MWLVFTAMRRPITILVAVLAAALTSIMAMRQMKVDIFPKLGAPAIYVAQPYGGMDPSQMEGYLFASGQHEAVVGVSLRAGGVHSVAVHGRRGAPAVCPAVARGRLRDDFLLCDLQHAGAGAGHMDVACGTSPRARLPRAAAILVSKTTGFGPRASLGGDWCLPGRDRSVYCHRPPPYRHGSLSCCRNEAAAAPAAGTNRYAPGAH